MGSVGNQNPFAPYDNYRDCSQVVCSIYCPQFCYLIFPPPPPSDDDDSGPALSPLIIAVIVALACAFLLVFYYTVARRYCRPTDAAGGEDGTRDEDSGDDQWQAVPSAGLDESLIKKITVCRYQKSGGLIDGSECAVCLSEFREDEPLRLMPKCSHAFHLPCIDTWLKSQSSCPLCRADVEAAAVVQTPPNSQASPRSVNVNSYEVQPTEDLVLVAAGDTERNSGEVVVTVSGNAEDEQERAHQQLRRSASLSSLTPPPARHLLISDILRFEDIDEYMQVECGHLWKGSGSSKGLPAEGELLRSPAAVNKFTPNARFMFHDRGKNSILPN